MIFAVIVVSLSVIVIVEPAVSTSPVTVTTVPREVAEVHLINVLTPSTVICLKTRPAVPVTLLVPVVKYSKNVAAPLQLKRTMPSAISTPVAVTKPLCAFEARITKVLSSAICANPLNTVPLQFMFARPYLSIVRLYDLLITPAPYVAATGLAA